MKARMPCGVDVSEGMRKAHIESCRRCWREGDARRVPDPPQESNSLRTFEHWPDEKKARWYIAQADAGRGRMAIKLVADYLRGGLVGQTASWALEAADRGLEQRGIELGPNATYFKEGFLAGARTAGQRVAQLEKERADQDEQLRQVYELLDKSAEELKGILEGMQEELLKR